jgi:hypothetical protein
MFGKNRGTAPLRAAEKTQSHKMDRNPSMERSLHEGDNPSFKISDRLTSE